MRSVSINCSSTCYSETVWVPVKQGGTTGETVVLLRIRNSIGAALGEMLVSSPHSWHRGGWKILEDKPCS